MQLPSSINKLIYYELSYDRRQLAADHQSFLQQLTLEQRGVYNKIIESVNGGKGGVFFLYGYGGTGKTFLWRTIAAGIRSKGNIVITGASSGIASLLLPGGRTTHSRFAILMDLDEFSTCNVKQGNQLADLLIRYKLIICDEAPMVNRHCTEALDRIMRDLLRFKNANSLATPFGGKTIVFGGDFRQILPVVQKGGRQDIVNATINSSYIWDSCIILKLTKNMRLRAANNTAEQVRLEEFAKWVLSIGDGKCDQTHDGFDKVVILDEFLIEGYDDPVTAICREIFPEMFDGDITNVDIHERAILAPTLKIVDEINQFMMSLNKEAAHTYYSSDKASPTEPTGATFASIHTPEFLNSIRCSGLPNHELTLKVGTPVMLLRNIDHAAGLCNGTRLVITKLGRHVIEAKEPFWQQKWGGDIHP